MKRLVKRKKKFLYNPMQMTEALKEMGEEYDKKEAILYYSAVFFVALILCFFFELRVKFIVLVAVVYLLFVPQLFYNQRKRAFEMRRFHDVNAYMSQMAQSFTRTGNVLHSLQETGNTFPSGKMKDVIIKAMDCIENGPYDVREAQKKAYKYIEMYCGCEKLVNLHDFLLTAESRGGECTTEFAILEKIRNVWEKAVLDYHRKLLFDRNLGSLLYGMMLGICVFIMKSFPQNLAIIHLLGIQIVNMLLLISFVAFFTVLDMRLNTSLLQEVNVMQKEKAESYYFYIMNYDEKTERRKYVIFPILMGILVVLWCLTDPKPSVLAIGIVFFVITLNIHIIIFHLTVWTVKREVERAFPKWLFDMMLLIQHNSIESAIFQSIEKAPPILQPELTRISDILAFEPKCADAYISFLADFNITGVESAMRKLYSLSVGTGGDVEVMKVIIETNLTFLSKAEERSITNKGEMSALVNLVPMFLISLGMLAYCAGLIFVSLSRVWELFG